MRLVVGLGNPGDEYIKTRHNAGFWWIDALVQRLQIEMKLEPKFHAYVGRYRTVDNDCWLIKPQTYMNDSGIAVQAFVNFYKIEIQGVIVVYDDLDLSPGVVKLKQGGGSGGHNGIQDIIRRIDGKFWRLRIGIGRPKTSGDVSPYVLGRASEEDAMSITNSIERSLNLWPELVSEDMDAVMREINGPR